MATLDELKSWDLTEKDFSMINDGLEKLRPAPLNEHVIKSFISSLPNIAGLKEELEGKLKHEMEQREASRILLAEEIKILQVKLIMIKRYMQENHILKEVNDILNDTKNN